MSYRIEKFRTPFIAGMNVLNENIDDNKKIIVEYHLSIF